MTVEDVLALLQRDPGRPRLTWYGPDDERIELSGAVLANWVTKVANLLVSEHDAGPGFRVLLDLPGHWRAVVWALGVWRVGACVVLPGAPGSVDLVVTSSPSAGPVPTYAVALPGLALRWPGSLPDGVMDAGPAVMGQPDVLGWVPGVEAGAVALHGPDRTVRHAEPAPSEPAARTARCAALDSDSLLAVLGDLAAGGSTILVEAAVVSDRSLRARLLADEAVTQDRLG